LDLRVLEANVLKFSSKISNGQQKTETSHTASLPLKDGAQTVSFKDPVRTAL
jgi:hypothetical protein